MIKLFMALTLTLNGIACNKNSDSAGLNNEIANAAIQQSDEN
jgi:hypothetical protein